MKFDVLPYVHTHESIATINPKSFIMLFWNLSLLPNQHQATPGLLSIIRDLHLLEFYINEVL